jgi:hypothetical protein
MLICALRNRSLGQSSRLNNQIHVVANAGFCMPLIGLGTWKSRKGLVREAVEQAIRCGYRVNAAHVKICVQ